MIFIDTTILPALLIPRKENVEALKRGPAVSVVNFLVGVAEPMATSVLTPPLLHKAGRETGISDKTLKAAAGQYEMLPVTAEDYAWAAEHDYAEDLEGALQVAVARRAGCRAFATTDEVRAARYSKHIKMLVLKP